MFKIYLKMFDFVFWDVIDIYVFRGFIVDGLFKMLYEVNNYMYNELFIKLVVYMMLLDIVDICQLFNDLEIVESQKDLVNEFRDIDWVCNQKIIDDVMEVFKKVFKENCYFSNLVSKIIWVKLVCFE